MGSITRAQAALFAAGAMMLLACFYLVDNTALLHDSSALIVSGSVAPSLIWAGFFLAVYRNVNAARTGAWIALVAVWLEALITYFRFQQTVNYWTPFGNALSLSGWLLRLGWTVFLITFALAPDHPRTRQIALALAIGLTPSTLSATYSAWNNWIGLLWDDVPRQAVWRVLITPGVQMIYWLSQILFLWTVWGNPEMRDPTGAASTRLAP